MRRRTVVRSLLGLSLVRLSVSALTVLVVHSAVAEDKRTATVLDGRRLFFDDAMRQRLDAEREHRTAAASPVPVATEPALPSTGARSRGDSAVTADTGGQATVDGRLGRQRIVDGVPLRNDSP